MVHRNILDKSPEDHRRMHRCGRTGCAAGGGPGICGIEGVFGRKCQIRDCRQNSSSQQLSGEMETRFEVLMAPKNVAPERCKNHNVAGFSLEFERVDDIQCRKRQNCELECKDGGERDWCGPVVETSRSPLDREVQNMNVLTASRERVLSLAGHFARLDYKEICVKASRCRGLKWWRWR